MHQASNFLRPSMHEISLRDSTWQIASFPWLLSYQDSYLRMVGTLHWWKKPFKNIEWRAFCISHTPYHTSPIQSEDSYGSCKSRMTYIGRLQNVSFDMYRVPSPFVFTIQQNFHWTSSGSVILNGLETTLITSPHMVTHSIWVSGPFVGRERSRLLFIYIQLRQSTKGYLK